MGPSSLRLPTFEQPKSSSYEWQSPPCIKPRPWEPSLQKNSNRFEGGLTISASEGTPATLLLYYEDAYLKEFEAKILKVFKLGDRHGVILDRTAFYHTGGGQPADTGVIQGKRGEISVVDVQMIEGAVVHIADEIQGNVKEGERVRGVVDWDRRYALMRNHTTAHVMGEAVRRATGIPVEVIGSAVGVDKARLDFAHQGSLGPLLPEIERVANSVVRENRLVEVKVLPRKQAEKYVENFHESLKIVPPQVQNVRIVEIKDWHACACGGTHVKTTGEIGAIKILRRGSKGRGIERIEFSAKRS